LPPVQPVVESAPQGPNQSLSFVAIQQLQLDQGFISTNDKRSLLEIQEEEQARRAEDDFLKWWATEEERVKQEAQVLAHSQGGKGTGLRKAKGPRRKPSAKITPAGSVGGFAGIDGAQSQWTPRGQNTRRQTNTSKSNFNATSGQ
jgi:hypothetical protein